MLRFTFHRVSAIAFTSLLFISLQGFATTWSGRDQYWVSYHFTKIAFGKQVRSVYIHTGILRQQRYGYDSTYWENVAHIPMEDKGNHFFAKLKLTAYPGEMEPNVIGPIVQYWVSFTDGTEMITDGSLLPVTDVTPPFYPSSSEFAFTCREFDLKFQTQTDADHTFAYLVHEAHSD